MMLAARFSVIPTRAVPQPLSPISHTRHVFPPASAAVADDDLLPWQSLSVFLMQGMTTYIYIYIYIYIWLSG